jgi:Glycosyl transferase family 2
MNVKKLAAPSIVLEWETVEDGGIDRAILGLRQISQQIAELQEHLRNPAEVIVCYEQRVIEAGELRAVFDRAAGPAGWACPVVFLPVPSGTSYYEKKNIGARTSVNEIIVFFDSDLIPDSGWLRSLLTPFQDWSMSVVLGATCLDHASRYEMAVALFWIFLPATHGCGVRPMRRYSSNNLGFRRQVFLKFPFPTRATYRGQCSELGRTLQDIGVTICEQTDARATHPPPAGVRGFLHRAWVAGQDEEFFCALSKKTSLATWAGQLARDHRIVAQRIRERSKVLHPDIWEKALGWLLSWAYYDIKAASYLAALWHKTPVKPVQPIAA